MFEERSRKLIGVLWIIVLLCALPGAMLADDDDDGDRKGKLVGTWRITLFPDTLNPVFSLFVFNEGNTMTERIAVHSISTVSGVWKKTRGDGNFALTSEGFIDMDPADGIFDNRFQGRWTIHVDGDTLAGTFTVDLLNLAGTLVVFPAAVQGARFEGTRMTVRPE